MDCRMGMRALAVLFCNHGPFTLDSAAVPLPALLRHEFVVDVSCSLRAVQSLYSVCTCAALTASRKLPRLIRAASDFASSSLTTAAAKEALAFVRSLSLFSLSQRNNMSQETRAATSLATDQLRRWLKGAGSNWVQSRAARVR